MGADPGGVLTLASVLILSSSSLAYSIGRVAPALAFVFAVWLLAAPLSGRLRGGALSAAALAAGMGAIAPLTRDANLIGHPGVLGSFADSAVVYRRLLGSSSLLAGAALTLVVLVTVHQLRTERGWRQPPQWAALALAAVWGSARVRLSAGLCHRGRKLGRRRAERRRAGRTRGRAPS